jgi:hypothetical protein
MPAFLILLYRFFRSLWTGLKDREFRAMFYWVLGILLLGTWFYAKVEDWRALDALYFTITTLTTVGYGDFSPKTDAGKIFTIFYIFVGIGLLSGFIILLGERSGLIKSQKNSEQAKDNSVSGSNNLK